MGLCFVESSVIYWLLLPFLLPCKRQQWLLFDSKSNGVSYRSNNTTGSSLIIAHWQISLAICAVWLNVMILLDACNVHSCGYYSNNGHAILLSALALHFQKK